MNRALTPAQKTTRLSDDFVEYWLEVWASAYRYPEDLGYETSVPFLSEGRYKEIIEEWTNEANLRAVGIIDATLEGMPDDERDAVSHRKFGCLYGHQRPVDEAYSAAKEKIGRKLIERDYL